MTLEQMEIMRNMLGFFHTPRKTYRNRFFVNKDHPDPRLEEMVGLGIVEKDDTDNAHDVYRVTQRWLDAMGVEVAR